MVGFLPLLDFRGRVRCRFRDLRCLVSDFGWVSMLWKKDKFLKNILFCIMINLIISHGVRKRILHIKCTVKVEFQANN